VVKCALAWNLQQLGQETSANWAHAMVICLHRYWMLKEAQRLAPVAGYDEEPLCANWNPEVPPLLQSNCQTELGPRLQRNKTDISRQKTTDDRERIPNGSPSSRAGIRRAKRSYRRR